MIEVFATNITSAGKAKRILTQIEEAFPDYIANFDLEDCDKILRIETHKTIIDTKSIIRLVKEMNGQASLL
ncbi:hypothetical protein EV198_0223 [Roseivirga ehrenbergii]|uniref:Uncharacterized protein n=1 Tax=Roseivirga ehrenbergii (strain DSM 102268 / JCM 13514 / KCTC 12282 / NCIMB 14502 / KMM 6017) TaxID=279360 RepID=A0A150X0D0_ROSEK|nr:hypothetical protein [Roseivirga ehrenbergii]KYG72167.1 hypothetical protein MB14_08965 [Roseivirga ehrenbergii]TCL13400.1 hypothetical protein EV198_0223 [Roseivirga ehrenbergii]